MISRRVRSVLLLLLVAFSAHAPALLGVFPGALPSTGDTLGAFVPWHEFTRQQLHRNGAIPLWNPQEYCGVPFAGNGQSALFYPPTYLHFLLPERFALWLFALLHSWFLMIGGAFLGRTLGLSKRASLLLALLLGLGNATPAHLFGGHLTFLPARAFWPWQAAFLLRILRGGAGANGAKNDARDAVCLAACVALGLAAGAPQIWLFGILFCGAILAFWVLRALQKRISPVYWPWKSGILALVLTILWCAPVFLPLCELKNWSSHGAMLSFAEVTALSATPRSLFRLLFANFFGHNASLGWSLPSNFSEDSASLGLAAGILACVAPLLTLQSSSSQKRITGALWLGSILTLLLALGNATPLYRALYDHVGLFRVIRVPARWLELWAFGAAILAAIAFDTVQQSSISARRLTKLLLGLALVCLLMVPVVWQLQTPWDFGARIVLRSFSSSLVQQAQTAARLRLDAWRCCFFGALTLGVLAFLMRRGAIDARDSGLQRRGFGETRSQIQPINLPQSRSKPPAQTGARCGGPEPAGAGLVAGSRIGSLRVGSLIWGRDFVSNHRIALVLIMLCGEPLINFWFGVMIATPGRVQNAQVSASLARRYRAGQRWIVSAPFQQLNAPLSAQIDALNGYEPFGSTPFFAFAGAAQRGARFSADFQPAQMSPLWRVMDASRVLWKPKFAGDTLRGFPGKTLARAGEWHLNSIDDGLKPWPRAYITRDLTRADGQNALESLQKMAAQPFSGAPPVVVSSDFPALTTAPLENAAPPESRLQSLRLITRTPDVREWQIATNRATIFVEIEALAPGWKAFVDARPTDIHLANAIFRGVLVPLQSRKIALIYDSETLRFGLFLSCCGLAFAAFCIASKR